jgi:hypothetical protein
LYSGENIELNSTGETTLVYGENMREKIDSRISVEFVLNVLRQHENDLDRLIAELDIIVDKVANITEKMQQIATDLTNSR